MAPRPFRRLVVMARWPAPGRCKTRLGAAIGMTGAARIQRQLSEHTLAASRPLASPPRPGDPGCELVLAVGGLGTCAARRWARSLGARRAVLQGDGDLGTRMARQLRRGFREGAQQVVLIGTDLPTLTTADLEAAFSAFSRSSLVLGPAADGGYWLIGLRSFRPGLFTGLPWGSADVLARTLGRAAREGLEPALLPLRNDLDRHRDLQPWLG